MLACRRVLSVRHSVPLRAATWSHHRRYTFKSSRTVLVHTELADSDVVQLASSLARIEADHTPLFMILSTPSFAPKILSSYGPTPLLQQLVSKIFKKSLKHRFGATLRGVRVLSAVVDAFPASISGQAAEGFAYAVLHTKDGKPDSIVTVADQADQHEHGTLEFQFSDDWIRQSKRDELVLADGETNYHVAMKLANTLFQSGRKKTMLDVTYAPDPTGDLYPVQHEWLAHCSIGYDTAGDHKLINSLDERASKTDKLFNVSLVPLTEPRKISVSLGNILRTIELSDGSSRPASHELEANLDAYFKATEQEPHARPVWALLMNQSGVERSEMFLHNASFLDSLSDEPGQRSSLEAIWAGVDTATVGSLRESIYLDGSKLQRVLSGGGGWGDKAGLLALDSQDSLRPQDANDEEISRFTSENTDFTHVQFFTSTNSTLSPLAGFPKGFWIGTIPDGLQKYQSHGGEKAEVYADTFGALSSGGMSLHIASVGGMSNTNKVTQTKIDVPFASFTYTLPGFHFETCKDNAQSLAEYLIKLAVPSTLAEGTGLLRKVTDSIWSTLREASEDLHGRAGVDLVKRRNEIKPIVDCILQVKRDVHPKGSIALSSGIQRFNQWVDFLAKTEHRRVLAVLAKQLRMGDELIDRIVSQIGKAVRAGNDDAKEAHEFNMVARQKLIADIYSSLISTVQTIRPELVENHVNAKYKTFRVLWGLRFHYLHNQWLMTDSFLANARRTIDYAKRNLNIPVTPYEGTPEAMTQNVASKLQDLFGGPGGGTSAT